MQPTIFSAGAKSDYFIDDWKSKLPLREKQYNTVYPIVLNKLKIRCTSDKIFCNSFLNGSNWIKSDAKVFLDHCHITEEGNGMIVEELIPKL